MAGLDPAICIRTGAVTDRRVKPGHDGSATPRYCPVITVRLQPLANPVLSPYSAATLSCVFVAKSLASCRSCNCSDGSPCSRFTIRPRFTAGRA